MLRRGGTRSGRAAWEGASRNIGADENSRPCNRRPGRLGRTERSGAPPVESCPPDLLLPESIRSERPPRSAEAGGSILMTSAPRSDRIIMQCARGHDGPDTVFFELVVETSATILWTLGAIRVLALLVTAVPVTLLALPASRRFRLCARYWVRRAPCWPDHAHDAFSGKARAEISDAAGAPRKLNADRVSARFRRALALPVRRREPVTPTG